MFTSNNSHHTDQTMAANLVNDNPRQDSAVLDGYNTTSTNSYTITANQSSFNTTTPFYETNLEFEIYGSPIGIIRLCFCAFGLLLNFFSMLAVAHIPRGKNSHIKLIMSLAVSDTLVIFSVLFLYLQQLHPTSSACGNLWARLFVDTSIHATLLNLLAMAIDRYLAVMKPLRYPQLMSKFRCHLMIFMLWFFSIFMGVMDPLVVLFTHPDSNYCEIASYDDYDAELVNSGFVMVVFIIMMVIYLKIYLVVRQLVRQPRTLTQDEETTYKAIITTFLILGTFAVCWLPYFIFQITMNALRQANVNLIKHFDTLILINDILYLVLLSNSLCDPIIYAVRLGQVKAGYKRMLFKYFPCYRQSLNKQEFRLHQSGYNHRRSTAATLVVDNDSGEINRRLGRQNTESEDKIYLTSITTDCTPEKKGLYTDDNKVTKDSDNDLHQTDKENNSTNDADSDRTIKNEIPDKEIENSESQTDHVIKEANSARSSATDLTPLSPISEKEFWSDNENSNLISKK